MWCFDGGLSECSIVLPRSAKKSLTRRSLSRQTAALCYGGNDSSGNDDEIDNSPVFDLGVHSKCAVVTRVAH